MKIKKLFIYNSINKWIGINIHKLIRKIVRPKWMKNSNDPFFVMKKWLKEGEYNPKVANKYEIKNILADIIDAPKNLFTFNKKGEILSGGIPESGKIVIKHSNGSNFVKIVDSSEVDQAFLAKLYKKWELYGSMYGTFLEEVQYRKAGNTFFAEEFIPGEPDDYKVHYFDEKEYTFLIVRDRGKAKYPYLEWDKTFSPMIDDTKMNMAPEMNEQDRKRYETLLPICKGISNKLGGYYFRGDFYFIGDKPYLGEITLSNSAGMVYGGKGNKQPKIQEQNKYFIDNYKRVNKMI